MAEITDDVTEELDKTILGIQRGTLCNVAKSGFPAVFGIVGASSGAADFGSTSVPGWFAGTVAGGLVAAAVCKVLQPIQDEADTINAPQSPRVQMVGLPTDLSADPSPNLGRLVAELLRIKAMLRVHST